MLSNRFCDLFKIDGAVFFLLNEMAHKELDQLCNPIQPPAFFFSYLSTFGDKKLSYFFVIFFFAFISEVVFLDSGFGDSEIFPTVVTLRPQSVLSFKAQTSDCR